MQLVMLMCCIMLYLTCSSEICWHLLYLFIRDRCTSWQSGSGCTLAAPSRFGRVSSSKRKFHTRRRQRKLRVAARGCLIGGVSIWKVPNFGESLSHWVPGVNLTYLNISSHQVSRYHWAWPWTDPSDPRSQWITLCRAAPVIPWDMVGVSRRASWPGPNGGGARCSFPIFVPLSFPKVTPNPAKNIIKASLEKIYHTERSQQFFQAICPCSGIY